MKGLHLLTLGDYVYIYSGLRDPESVALIASKSRLADWSSDIDALFVELAQLPKNVDGADANPSDISATANVPDPTTTAPAAAPPAPDLQQLDRLAEASIRVARSGLTLGYDQATSRQNPADADLWKAADAFLFENGLAFLKSSLPEQVGETTRLLQRAADPSLSWLHARFNVHGQTFAAVLADIQAHNQAIAAILKAALTTPSLQTEISRTVLRRKAQKLLSVILPVFDSVFPAHDPQHAKARDTLLAPLQERVAFRIARRDQAKRDKEKQKELAAPTTTPTTGAASQ